MKDGDQSQKDGQEREIKKPIRTIDEVKDLILGDAGQRVASLDWGHFGITDKAEITGYCADTAPFVFKRTSGRFPIAIFDMHRPNEEAILNKIVPERKTPISEDRQYWLAMLKGSIEPDEANFMRDHLLISLSQGLAVHNDISVDKVRSHFMQVNQPFKQALLRSASYILAKAKG